MKPWNRLRRLAGRLVAGDHRPERSDEAIFLTQTTWRNHQPQELSAPQIRQRYFGADLRREKDGEDAKARKVRPGLLSRLGFMRDRRISSDEQNYFGTRIQDAPHPSPGPETSVPGPEIPLKAPVVQNRAAEADGRPSPGESAVLDSLFGKETPADPPEPVTQTAPPLRQQTMTKPVPETKKRTAAPKPAPAATKATSGQEKPARKKKRRKMDRSDVTIASLGILLGVTCAVFPWYIFFNQEKFGVREFVFSGRGTGEPASGVTYLPQPVGQPFAAADVPKMELDFFPTATLPPEAEPTRAAPASEQPFPADRAGFTLVHVANGRAMIEDGDGLWVVQRGSRLPDASHVAAIEQRNGRWVLVTTTDKVVELTR